MTATETTMARAEELLENSAANTYPAENTKI